MPLEIYHTFILSQRTSLVYTTFLAIAINKIAASLPFIGPTITALQAQPQCLTAVKWSSFTLQIPGGVITGQMFFKMVEYFLCFLADLDETLSFFSDVCTSVSAVGQVSLRHIESDYFQCKSTLIVCTLIVCLV